MQYQKTVDRIYEAYIEAMLFTECDDDGLPLDDNYHIYDLTETAKQRAMEDILDFLELLERENINWWEYGTDERLGHDFWLTRNGHGAGFWDGDWSEIGDTLTALCKPYGYCYAWPTDDGQIELL